jgi:hypothetical protein
MHLTTGYFSARFCVTALLLCFFVQKPVAQQVAKPRIVITADPELDDNNSLIRLLLYSSDLTIEGLVYASSGYHWKGNGKGTKWFVPNREYARFGLDTCPCSSWRWAKDERFIHDAVAAYEKVYPNLKVHHTGYPAPATLKNVIRYGNIEFDGEMAVNTPGSDLIRSLILDDKPGPLFITAWGGQSTIARALKSIEEQYQHSSGWQALQQKIYSKVVLLPSGDQDDTYALYIRPHWPGIEYRQFAGGPNYGYGAQLGAKAANAAYLTASWMQANVHNKGPLGSLYRVWGDGKQMVPGDKLDYFGIAGKTDDELRRMGYVVWMPVQPKGSWLGEGDNHTFMNMLGNGLRAYESAAYGGWGGRGADSKQAINFTLPATDGSTADTSAAAMAAVLSTINSQQNKQEGTIVFPDFFPQAQQDFAARLLWSVTPRFANANHAPVISIQGPLQVLAAAGETIRLNAVLTDADGNAVSINWWQMPAGSYTGKVNIISPASTVVKIQVPADAAAGQTIHIIAEAVDNGTPTLASYQRVIITVKAK